MIASFVLRSYSFRAESILEDAKIKNDKDEAISNLYNIIFHLDPRNKSHQNLRELLETFYGASKKHEDVEILKDLERKIKRQAGRVFILEKEKISRWFSGWYYFKFGEGKKLLIEAEKELK